MSVTSKGHRKLMSAEELAVISEAAAISMNIMEELSVAVVPGVKPAELDKLAGDLCKSRKVLPAFKGVPGVVPFPGNLCICVNDEVLHAIPSSRPLVEGDLVKLDFGVIHHGLYTDHCVTVAAGSIRSEDSSLLKTGKLAVESAVDLAGPGVATGDLGHRMQSIVELAGFNVLTGYVGHGIGRSLHEFPQIPAYGDPGTGDILEAGMVVCIEAQVVAGDSEVFTAPDWWTVKTEDGSRAVMFEYMVLITKDGHEILTDTRSWPLVGGKSD